MFRVATDKCEETVNMNEYQMENIYGNVDYDLNKQDSLPAVSVKDSHSFKVTNILLAALSFLLLASFGVICTLSVLYYNKVVLCETLSKQYNNATERLAMQNYNASVATEMKSQLDQLQVRYDNASKHLALLKAEKEDKYKVLNSNHRRTHEVLTTCAASQNCGLCENGWTSLGLKCYYFSTDQLNWTRSQNYCEVKGGHLVIITSKAEQDFLSSRVTKSHWIGLNDLETEGMWLWVDNEPLDQTWAKTFWHARTSGINEPDNWKIEDSLGENCGALGNESGYLQQWFDASCKKMKQFICEK